MNKQQMIERTKRFAKEVIAFCDHLPKRRSTAILAYQLVKAATSVGANYRACGRAKSYADFVSKLGKVLEEADETCYWLDLFQCEENTREEKRRVKFLVEANEITAIVAKSLKTARNNLKVIKHKS